MPAGMEFQCDDSLPAGEDDPVELRNGTPSTGRHSRNFQGLVAHVFHNEIVRDNLALLHFTEIELRLLDQYLGALNGLSLARAGHGRHAEEKQQCDKLVIHLQLFSCVSVDPQGSLFYASSSCFRR